MRSQNGLAIFTLLVASSAVESSTIDYATARFERKLLAVRASTPIVLDGVLDEAAWREAPLAANFYQNEPHEGDPASEQTEVRVLYDNESLYIGVFAKDREPEKIIVNELKKDFNIQAADAFGVVLDTFHDERNGYQFGVNAAGAKWDAQMSNEGREMNANWDGIWFVKTRIAEDGWYAEISIPFRTLKFPSESPQTWGINFLRRLRRRNEDSFWSPLPRIFRLMNVSMAGTLENLRAIRPGDHLRVKPYVLGSGSQVGTADVLGDSDFGVDAKWGLTTTLTWDFTYNTDFSQVEADEQQVNLTRFSLFFPEKRDFFLENSGIYQFGPGNERGGGGGGGGGGGVGGGRQNAQQNDLILFFSRRIGIGDAGNEIPILGGTRLTGRVGGVTIGALSLQQDGQGATPSTNFTALRVRSDIFANSDIGLMFLNKEPTGALYNRAAGADANFRFFRDFNINTFAAMTESPDAVVGGPGRNTALRAGMNWRGSFWEMRGFWLSIGDRFNDEMGFVPRKGIVKTEAFVGTHIRPKATSSWLREIFPHFQISNIERQESLGGGLDSRYYDYHLPFTLQNSTFIEMGVNPNIEILLNPFVINTRRGISIAPGRYEFSEYFLLFNTDRSARLAFNGRYSNGEFYDGYKRGYTLGVDARVNEQLNVSASLSTNDVDLPKGSFVTNLVTGRVNYSFSTRMFLNALLQYNTDARQWSANVRFHLIHRPLSDFYLVYNEQRDTVSSNLINRALIAKFTYMFAF